MELILKIALLWTLLSFIVAGCFSLALMGTTPNVDVDPRDLPPNGRH